MSERCCGECGLWAQSAEQKARLSMFGRCVWGDQKRAPFWLEINVTPEMVSDSHGQDCPAFTPKEKTDDAG